MRVGARTLDLSAAEGARIVALGLLDEAEEAARLLAGGAGAEPLHDFRVGVRRLRSALRTFRRWLGPGIRPRDERRLRQIARSTNAARDAEVQRAWLAATRDAVSSPPLLPGHALAVARIEERLRAGPEPPRVAARFQRASARLRRHLVAPPRQGSRGGSAGAAFGPVLAGLVRAQVEALADRLEAIHDALDEEGAHRARIEGKRLRYLLEPLRGCSRADSARAVGRLKRLQDLLGDLHDAHVLAREVGTWLGEVSAERARRVYAATLAGRPGGAGVRDALRDSPRPGLLSLGRRLRDRRDACFAELERERRAGAMAELADEIGRLAAALEARRPRPRRR